MLMNWGENATKIEGGRKEKGGEEKKEKKGDRSCVLEHKKQRTRGQTQRSLLLCFRVFFVFVFNAVYQNVPRNQALCKSSPYLLLLKRGAAIERGTKCLFCVPVLTNGKEKNSPHSRTAAITSTELLISALHSAHVTLFFAPYPILLFPCL